MPHCTQCGTALAPDARFCPSCGRSQPAPGTPVAPVAPAAPAAQSGLSENTAALLCYVLWWVTGLIFYLIDSRPFVRFHAAQSLVTFGGLHIIRIVVSAVFGYGWWYYGGWANLGVGALLLGALGLISLVLWIVCMVRAYQGVRFKVPIAGDIAEGMAGR
ncbi:MAG: zinc-ribbon domain-containing protein [Candidatus Acidiferrales bacterium]